VTTKLRLQLGDAAFGSLREQPRPIVGHMHAVDAWLLEFDVVRAASLAGAGT
jgi:hypothetical protein